MTGSEPCWWFRVGWLLTGRLLWVVAGLGAVLLGLVCSRPPPAGRVTSQAGCPAGRDVRALASLPFRAAGPRVRLPARGWRSIGAVGRGELWWLAGVGEADLAGRGQGAVG